MNIITAKQGSQEWLDIRKKYYCASDASAMMGFSQFKPRDDYILEKVTGAVKPVSDYTQSLFDKGHDAEKRIRPFIAEKLDIDLFPVVVTTKYENRLNSFNEIKSLDLLASLDGVDIEFSIIFEHKLFNKQLIEDIKNNTIGPRYYWQLEHQLLVTNANKVIFVCSDGTPDNCHFLEYKSRDDRRIQLIEGWLLADNEINNYKQSKKWDISKAEKQQDNLPSLVIDIDSKINTSNLVEYKQQADLFIESLKTDLITDNDFAKAAESVKLCKKIENDLNEAKKQALSKAYDVSQLFELIDSISADIRQRRLDLDKQVKARKDEIKQEIIKDSKCKLEDYIDTLNKQLGGAYLDVSDYDNFTSNIKNRKTAQAIQTACNDALFKAKLEINKHLENIKANIPYVENNKYKPVLQITEFKKPKNEFRIYADRVFSVLDGWQVTDQEVDEITSDYVGSATCDRTFKTEPITDEVTITITIEEYNALKKDSEILQYFYDAGVENWSGYEYVQEIMSRIDG